MNFFPAISFLKKITLLQILIVCLLVCLLITLVIRYRLIFLASSDIGGIESNVVYSIQRYMAGYALYANPEVAPYSITQYSPLYYRVAAALGLLTNIDPDNTLAVYRLSRILSLAANSCYALLIYSLSQRLYPAPKVSLAVAIIAFVLLPPQLYSRPDSIYTLLVIATLYTGLRATAVSQEKDQYRWLTGSVFLAALAISTKQSGIVLPVILTGYYALFQQQWVKAIVIGLSISGLGLFFLLGLMPEHDPMLLYSNIVTGVSQGLDSASFKVNIIDHFFRTFTIYNTLGIPLCIWFMRQTKSSYRWVGWCVLVLFGFSLLTSLKSGSALNYFTEYIALTGLLAAIWIQHESRIKQHWNGTWSLLLLSAIFWAVIPNIPNFNWSPALNRNALSERPYLQQKEIADYLKDSLKLKPTEFVFITTYNYSYLNGLLYRNCLIPQQDIVSVMYPGKKINYSAFDRQISQHGIRYLITGTNEKTTLFAGLTTDHFQLKRRFPEFDVYESR